jgi:choline-sulfatase
MKPANVLYILSDEHDPRFMGCSDHPTWRDLIQTPNIDRLAARGTRFTAAYTPSPICVPARASWATGRYVHELGFWDNAMAYDGSVPGWGHRLQEAGISVESIGKLHYRNIDDPTGFDKQHDPMHIWEGIGQVWGSVRDPLPASKVTGATFKQIGPGETTYNRYDRAVADQAVDWLNAHAEDAKPWALYLGFVAPHFPLVVPEEFFNLYPIDSLPFPKLHTSRGYEPHPWLRASLDFRGDDATFGTDERRLTALASYMGLCTFIDAEIGKVLTALNRAGLADTTRVVYSSDHGDNMGARGAWGKSNLYQESTNIPMIAAGPDIPAGKVSTTPVSLVDTYQTILSGVGIAPATADGLPGRSIFEIAGEADALDRVAFSEYHAVGSPSGAFMARKGRWKYHYYAGYSPELFDLESDPEETVNLAMGAAYAHQVNMMEGVLRQICDPDAVDAQAKADQAALIERHGGREAAMLAGTPGATPVPGGGHE